MDGDQETTKTFWHVVNCKLSHVDTKVDVNFIEVLQQEYESTFKDGYGKITVNRGKIHKYLGMTIDYTTKDFCKTMIFDYIK